jgi:hypothetical protein
MLERLIPMEPLKPYKERLLDISLDIVKRDNEENAVLAAKVYICVCVCVCVLCVYLFIDKY